MYLLCSPKSYIFSLEQLGLLQQVIYGSFISFCSRVKVSNILLLEKNYTSGEMEVRSERVRLLAKDGVVQWNGMCFCTYWRARKVEFLFVSSDWVERLDGVITPLWNTKKFSPSTS